MCRWATPTLPTARSRKFTKIYRPRKIPRDEHQRHALRGDDKQILPGEPQEARREPRRGLDRAQQGLLGQEPQNLTRHEERVLPNRGETITNKVEDIKSKIELLTQTVKNLEELYNENIYEMNKKLDNMIEKHVCETKKIYEMEQSKLIDLLNQKFNDVQLKFEPLLSETIFYQNFKVYDMASTTPTASGSSTPRSSSRSSSSSTIKSKSIVYENNDENIYAENIYGESNEEIIYEDDPHSILREFATHDI